MFNFMSLKRLATALAAMSLVTLTGGTGLPTGSTSTMRSPQLVLWAWERPESLLFADSAAVGVAFLSESTFLEQQPVLRPRLQPLRVGPKTRLTAVVRLEITPRTPKAFDHSYASTVAQWIADVAREPQVEAVQNRFRRDLDDAAYPRHEAIRQRRPAAHCEVSRRRSIP